MHIIFCENDSTLQKKRYIAWVILWRLKRPPQIEII